MPSRPITIREIGFLVVALCATALAGCAQKKVQAAVPVLAPPAPGVHPMTIAPDTDASPPLEAGAAAPSVPASSAGPDMNVPVGPVVPPPRRATAAQSPSNSEQDAAAHPAPPRIEPQLSSGDQQAYQRRIDDDSAVAQKNLQSVGSRQLNATQRDLVDKIRSFLGQALDAGKDGDWARAENLAQKARLLSVELVNSL